MSGMLRPHIDVDLKELNSYRYYFESMFKSCKMLRILKG